jgi:hypothetical protein
VTIRPSGPMYIGVDADLVLVGATAV